MGRQAGSNMFRYIHVSFSSGKGPSGKYKCPAAEEAWSDSLPSAPHPLLTESQGQGRKPRKVTTWTLLCHLNSKGGSTSRAGRKAAEATSAVLGPLGSEGRGQLFRPLGGWVPGTLQWQRISRTSSCTFLVKVSRVQGYTCPKTQDQFSLLGKPWQAVSAQLPGVGQRP